MAKIFVDSNIFVYGADNKDRKRRDASRALLKRAGEDHIVVLSTQVLQEFYAVATRKMGVEPLMAKSILTSLEQFEIVTVTPALIKEAVDCQIISRLSFWDALIVVSAESARCEILWSEDFNPGRTIRGVRVENPLLASA